MAIGVQDSSFQKNYLILSRQADKNFIQVMVSIQQNDP